MQQGLLISMSSIGGASSSTKSTQKYHHRVVTAGSRSIRSSCTTHCPTHQRHHHQQHHHLTSSVKNNRICFYPMNQCLAMRYSSSLSSASRQDDDDSMKSRSNTTLRISQLPWKRMIPAIIETLKEVWVAYIHTFEPIFPGICKRMFGKEYEIDEDTGMVVEMVEVKEDEDAPSESNEIGDSSNLNVSVKGIEKNINRNTKFMKKRGDEILKIAKEETGISNKEELRQWINEQVKLGTLCLSQFMEGYREGRDNELDRMINEYFTDLDEEDDKVEDEGSMNTGSRKS